MKLSIKPLAAAVSLALISVSAHAQLASPVQGSAVPGSTGLFLEAWNTVSGATELVNLSYAYTDIASANLGNLNTATGPAWTAATNPSTGTGSVNQLNFGTIANAGTAGFTNYAVVSGATATQTGIAHIQGAAITGSDVTSITNSSLAAGILAMQTEVSNWTSLSASGTYFDATGATPIGAANGPAAGGTFNTGTNISGTVGSAQNFYNILGNTSSSVTYDGIAPHHVAMSTYAGFWFLSSTGQLSYNIASAAAPVPLPAAVWLLGSGLLGLIGVGRRRLGTAA